jgi:twitching motility two-component system response regulator PilH
MEHVAQPKILVVDDSPTELALARSVLQQAGYRIVTAQDGDQALAIAEAESPDLVVLDIIMPRKNGYQVCRQLKTQGPEKGQPRVLILSTKSQEADKFWALKQGADMYMTKPFEASELLGNVRTLLR